MRQPARAMETAGGSGRPNPAGLAIDKSRLAFTRSRHVATVPCEGNVLARWGTVMAFRRFRLTALLTGAALLLLSTAPPRAQSAPPFAPYLAIYTAKGAPNSCGPGCDRWIAIEGKVEFNSANRVRMFLTHMPDPLPPIYLNSPGGRGDHAFGIARYLRMRGATTRVGQTMATACSPEAQADDRCLVIKLGGDVQAKLSTEGTVCASACVFMLLGGAVREVAPDTLIGIHEGRFESRNGRRIESELTHQRIATSFSIFIQAMGVEHELADLILAVPTDDIRYMTREEIYRVNIDRREFVESAWTLVPGARPYARKIADAKRNNDGSFRRLEWRLSCEGGQSARLMFLREADQTASGDGAVGGPSSVSVTAAPGRTAVLAAASLPFQGREAWSTLFDAEAVNALLVQPRIAFEEKQSPSDGKPMQNTFTIDMQDLSNLWTELSANCGQPVGVRKNLDVAKPRGVTSPWPVEAR